MTLPRWQRLVNHVAPFQRLYAAERRRHAVTKSDLQAHAVHFALACSQRDAALEQARTATAAAMSAEARCRRLNEQLDLLVRDAIEAWEADL